MNEMFPIEEVRRQFPALKRTYKGRPVAYFDGPGGSQVVQASIDAIAEYMTGGGANLHGEFPTSLASGNSLCGISHTGDKFRTL